MSKINLLAFVVLSACLITGCEGVKADPDATADATTVSQSESITPETGETEAPDAPFATNKDQPESSYDADDHWPLFRGDTKSTGVARSSLPDKLDINWQFEVKKGAFQGTAAIVETKLGKAAIIGDLDGKLFALNLNNGEKLWEFNAGHLAGFVTAPAVLDGKIYVGDVDGIFHCLDEQGNELWKHEAAAQIDSSANFYKDRVIFGSQDAYLYALDVKTGEPVWQHESADQIRCSVTIVDDRAFVAGCDGGFHLVDLNDGSEATSVDMESQTGVTPAIMGDVAYLGTEQAGFLAIDWRKAEVMWRFPTDAPVHSSPAVTDKHVVFAAVNRTVYSLDPGTGKQKWMTTLKSKIESSPVIVGDRVFVGSTDGRFYQLDLEKGDIEWQTELNGGIVGSPAVGFGKIIIATDQGVVYCLGAAQ